MTQSMKIKKTSLSPLRQIIRDRMNESCKIPQFCLEIEVNMKKILEVREKLVLRPSITACLVWSCARALREKPELNGYFYGDEIGHTSDINIGVAISIPEGLLVPVIREADKKKLEEINQELTIFNKKIKSKKLSPDDLQEGTFTLSNLGMYGITSFIPLLNPPQLAILGVGALCEGCKVNENKIETYQYIKVTMVADHRALDGAVAADFLSIFKRICEGEFHKGDWL
jgi:pyruvate dehydrogenase E2 component (dihydrolipoamide acetyltransferase)